MTPTTRPANTTVYSGGQIVCAATCIPMQMALANAQSLGATTAFLNRLTLLKSGTSKTNASFNVLLFSQVPVVPSGGDQAAYVGPYVADFPGYLGQASCTNGTSTSDSTSQVWYECALQNPNSSGVFQIQRAIGSANPTLVYGLIEVPASTAYTPASGETFTAYLSGFF
jgi:hypothetical protein